MSISTDSEWASNASIQTASPLAESETPPPKDPASKLFDEAAEGIHPDFHYAFTTSGNLRKKLIRVQSKYKDTMIRLLVTGVNEDGVDTGIRKLPFCPALRVWYECDVDAAIIKIMPVPEHEITSRQFYGEILMHVAQIPGHSNRSVAGVGATRYRCSGKRGKEGDDGFKCSTRVGGATWPNLMIEVGHSEPLSQLRIDARWWLEASNGLTRMAIIIMVTRNPDNLHLEVWRLQPNTNQRTCHSPNNAPAIINSLDINAAGTVTPPNANLTIPYTVMFDNPHINAADIVLTTMELSSLATGIFAAFS
ncbi:hypothetical protein BDD12DRAFT_833386 [Trichophaea hybrida]|nr:hypothetical protein BDD12DRAFT_833386 [Trichophaea hybrida]